MVFVSARHRTWRYPAIKRVLEDAHKDAVTLIKEKFDEMVKKHY